mmetsp:Transcript_8282/g.25978  ORF Transcript_8282/g.25978 Transcript_8282/m.25978 type:complete len:210 (-) Transcript_8282:294-923(-)
MDEDRGDLRLPQPRAAVHEAAHRLARHVAVELLQARQDGRERPDVDLAVAPELLDHHPLAALLAAHLRRVFRRRVLSREVLDALPESLLVGAAPRVGLRLEESRVRFRHVRPDLGQRPVEQRRRDRLGRHGHRRAVRAGLEAAAALRDGRDRGRVRDEHPAVELDAGIRRDLADAPREVIDLLLGPRPRRHVVLALLLGRHRLRRAAVR